MIVLRGVVDREDDGSLGKEAFDFLCPKITGHLKAQPVGSGNHPEISSQEVIGAAILVRLPRTEKSPALLGFADFQCHRDFGNPRSQAGDPKSTPPNSTHT